MACTEPVFLWVPWNYDMFGNELADTAAKQAARQFPHANPLAAIKDVSRSIMSELSAKLHQNWEINGHPSLKMFKCTSGAWSVNIVQTHRRQVILNRL